MVNKSENIALSPPPWVLGHHCIGVTSTLTAYLTPYATLVHQSNVLSTQDKHHLSWAASSIAAAAL